MKLYAISDLHVGYATNRKALHAMLPRPDDWLIVAGDVAESEEAVMATLAYLARLFARVIWVPGNHELWTTREGGLRGVAKYERLVRLCRELGVLTPEDEYPVWEGEGGRHLLAPLFLLYDYSFCPPGLSPEQALEWAAESGIVCADEHLLHPDPFPTRQAWCEHRCRITEARLEAARARGLPLVLVNHFPLEDALARLPAVPRFRIWCGTRRSAGWAQRFGASVVVGGHLHIRGTRQLDGVRYEEVSLGYPPRQWHVESGVDAYLRQILPG